MPPWLWLLPQHRSGGRLITRPRKKIHLFSAIVVSLPADWGGLWIFLITSKHAAILFSILWEIWGQETADDMWFIFYFWCFFLTLFIFPCTKFCDRPPPHSPLLFFPSARTSAGGSHPCVIRDGRHGSRGTRRENINKNIKRRHLLSDCCVHLYTSLHHYGLFSLQIKPKIVQITRRLKSF